MLSRLGTSVKLNVLTNYISNGRCIPPILSCSLVTDSRKISPISMAYDQITANNNERSSVLVMHGLLGSKKNWKSMMHSMTPSIARSVYLLDARNHGDSPHTDAFNYDVLAEDVQFFMKKHQLKKACLLGHSLGGRAMMALALQNPSLVEKLIVVDISPIALPEGSSKSLDYINEMAKVRFAHPVTFSNARKAVDTLLTKVCEEKFIRSFLMTNIDVQNGNFKWKANIESLRDNYLSGIGKFPQSEMGRTFEGETHFISGQNSNYVRTENYQDILAIFPRAKFHVIKDAGHFVHADQPQLVREVLTPILSS